MAQIPKGRLVKGPYKPICRDRAIYFSITVICFCLTLYNLVLHDPICLAHNFSNSVER